MSLIDAFSLALAEEQILKEAVFTAETLSEFSAVKLDLDHVHFLRCRFIACDFSGSSFMRTTFENCDFSNCRFDNSFWKDCMIKSSKCNGAVFERATLRNTEFEDTPCRYINLTHALLDHCTFINCDMREGALSEMKIRQSAFHRINFTQADFFHTPLKGVDLSDCTIDGILVSDSHAELRGLKIGVDQTAYIAAMLGVEIIH